MHRHGDQGSQDSDGSCRSLCPTHPCVAFYHAHLKGPRPLPRAYPQVLLTIGDHLRKRRLDLGLPQREVAERLGVTESTVTNWELNRARPALRFIPGLIRLLGYVPYPAGMTLADRLVACRTAQGLSQEATARRWERSVRVPTGRSRRLVEAFLETPPAFTPFNSWADVGR